MSNAEQPRRNKGLPVPHGVLFRDLVSAIALVAAFGFVIAGCGGGSPKVNPSIPPGSPTTPTPIQDAEQRAQQLSSGFLYRFDMISPNNDRFGVTTREFYLYFKPDTNFVSFRIENRMGVAAKILWDEMTFDDVYGRNWKVIHRGITYDNRTLPQEPTWIQAQQVYQDWVAPVDLLNDPSAAGGGPMRLLLRTDNSAQSLVGRTFGFKLVMGAENDQRLEFDVRFRIASVYPVGR
ncbi:MAG: hypothetical protein ACREOU_06655 [Candidatus Eiseniibacteriota bacterium]